jgi:hypothetical protein
MPLARRFLCVITLAACSALAACASDDGASGASSAGGDEPRASVSAPSGGSWDEAAPVTGQVQVAWRNLDPSYPAAAVGLVNESSETGQKLKSGRATSSQVRVLTDSQMGGLLAALDKVGFFRYAQDGLSLDNLPEAAGRKGVVVVTRDGHSVGLMLTTNLGASPVPKTYTDSKNMILAAHGSVQGFEARAGAGEADERIFSVPKPTLRRP